MRAAAHARAAARAELNGLALAWAVFKDWLRGLFWQEGAREHVRRQRMDEIATLRSELQDAGYVAERRRSRRRCC